MRSIYAILISMFLLSTNIISQKSNLYVPLNVQQAIKNGTRSYDGKPGANYWQNKSDYKINAEVLPDSGYLIGDEEIKYYNNSPDSLKIIVVRLYQDISKKGALRDWYVGQNGFNDGVKLNYFIVGSDTLDVSPESKNIRRGSTNIFVKLKKPLVPKTNIKIKIGWEFEIPKVLKIRMGNYGNGNLYVAYWYPEIAVYDDIDGWDRIDYQGSVEFYNDFSNFDFSLKVPAGYVLWSTGELQNAEDVLRNDIYENYKKAKSSNETIRIISQEDYKKGLVTAVNDLNTWKFKAENVTSVAFAMSKSFNWDGTSVEVDKKSGRRVLTDAVYPDSTIYWDKAAEYARASIEYMSFKLPGYSYPYSHSTSFCNGNLGGGMESPMMNNDGAPKSVGRIVGLLFHEISHNYFPFIMGTNERKYAWMDEGWANFLTNDIVNKYVPDYDYRKRMTKAYTITAGKESELPPIVPSYSYKGRYARTGFYTRPSTAYFELQKLLGNNLFKKALLEYIDRWNGKHPIPQDFFFTFNEVVGEDLTWFWNPWFYEFGYPDLAIDNVEKGEGFVSVIIKKAGKLPTSVNITFEFEDGSKKEIEKSSRVWSKGKTELRIRLDTNKIIKRIILGNDHTADAVPENNEYKF